MLYIYAGGHARAHTHTHTLSDVHTHSRTCLVSAAYIIMVYYRLRRTLGPICMTLPANPATRLRVCVCLCVCERERESAYIYIYIYIYIQRERFILYKTCYCQALRHTTMRPQGMLPKGRKDTREECVHLSQDIRRVERILC
jgi:hypothetical protein